MFGFWCLVRKSEKKKKKRENIEALYERLKTLLYFFQCMTVRGIYLEPYMKQIKSILRKALRIQNKEGHSTAVILLKNMLRSLTSVYPKEYWSCPEGYDRPLSEHLPIRQWGKPGNIHSLKVSIQCPIID